MCCYVYLRCSTSFIIFCMSLQFWYVFVKSFTCFFVFLLVGYAFFVIWVSLGVFLYIWAYLCTPVHVWAYQGIWAFLGVSVQTMQRKKSENVVCNSVALRPSCCELQLNCVRVAPPLLLGTIVMVSLHGVLGYLCVPCAVCMFLVVVIFSIDMPSRGHKWQCVFTVLIGYVFWKDNGF